MANGINVTSNITDSEEVSYVATPSLTVTSEVFVGLKGDKGDQGDPASNLVDSVNGQQGAVVLDTDDISEGANKYVTAAEKTKLSNLSGTNTGDQDLSGLVPNTRTINGYALSSNVSLTKSDVGLSNVDNTSDASKPISTATQTALNAKQGTITLTTTGTSGASTLVGNTLNIPQYSGGGGGVTSVNGDTGVVVLDADDISDTSTTHKFVTAADITKLSNLSGTNTGDQNLSTYVQGPASAVDKNLAYADGTTGKLVNYSPSVRLVDSGEDYGDLLRVGDGIGYTDYGQNAALSNGNYTIVAADTVFLSPGTGTTSASNKRITSVAAPTSGGDATNKTYVDGLDAQNVKLTGTQTVAGDKTFSGNSTLQAITTISQGFRMGALPRTSAVTLASTSAPLNFCNATGGAFTITLPTAAGRIGQMFFFKKIDASANAITIARSGAETIDGATSQSLSTQYQAITVVSDGTNWYIGL